MFLILIISPRLDSQLGPVSQEAVSPLVMCEGVCELHQPPWMSVFLSFTIGLAVLTLTLLVWLLFTYRNSLYTWLVLIIVL